MDGAVARRAVVGVELDRFPFLPAEAQKSRLDVNGGVDLVTGTIDRPVAEEVGRNVVCKNRSNAECGKNRR